jgi:hypothetical protein
MRPVRWSQQPGEEEAHPLAEFDTVLVATPAEPVPEECPAVFSEQPLERWSPRDLIVGVSRLVRWTGFATS